MSVGRERESRGSIFGPESYEVIWKPEEKQMIWRISYDLLALENSSCFHVTRHFLMTSYGFYSYWSSDMLPVFYMSFLHMNLNHMLSQYTSHLWIWLGTKDTVSGVVKKRAEWWWFWKFVLKFPGWIRNACVISQWFIHEFPPLSCRVEFPADGV